MNTIGDRIKQLRESLSMTAKDFGARVGIGNSSVSKIEKGVNGTTDQTIKSICREFHVREEWLREGVGEMYEPEKPSDSLSLFLKANCIDDLEEELARAYLSLSPDLRRAFLDHFKAYFARKNALQAHPPGDSEKEAGHDSK